MARLIGEPVRTVVEGGQPRLFLWRRRLYRVGAVVDRWREAGEWWQGEPVREFFRVETSGRSPGLYDVLKTLGQEPLRHLPLGRALHLEAANGVPLLVHDEDLGVTPWGWHLCPHPCPGSLSLASRCSQSHPGWVLLLLALVRPGPMKSKMHENYLRVRQGKEPAKYLDPRLEPVLRETLGWFISSYMQTVLLSRLQAGAIGFDAFA